MNRVILLIAIPFLFLAACQSPPLTVALELSPSFIRTSTPNPSRTLIPPSATPSHTFSPTKTQTSTLTPSPASTDSDWFPPTLSPPTLTAFATLDALVTQFPELRKFYTWDCVLSPCYTPGLGLSPNGLWAAFFDAEESGGVRIVSVDGEKQWKVYYSEISDYPCPCGDSLVAIEHWSLDGRYLYISPFQSGSGGDDWFWRDSTKLIRLNLENGTWVDTKMGPAFSFSPNDQYLVYRANSEVRIREFKTGDAKVLTISSDYLKFGRFVWSPDSKKIMFVASATSLSVNEPTGFTIFLIDLNDPSLQTIFEEDNRFLYPKEWREPNVIQFVGYFDSLEKYIFNLITNEFVPIEP